MIERKNPVWLHKLHPADMKDDRPQLMLGSNAQVGFVGDAVESLLLQHDYDVRVDNVHYIFTTGEDHGPIIHDDVVMHALTAEKTDSLLQQPGRHIFLGAGSLARSSADDLSNLYFARDIANSAYNIGQAGIAFIGTDNLFPETVSKLGGANGGRLIYAWSDWSLTGEERSDASAAFFPFAGNVTKPDHDLYEEAYRQFQEQHPAFARLDRPLVILHLPGTADGRPFSAGEAAAYTRDVIARRSGEAAQKGQAKPVFMAIQGNRTEDRVMSEVAASFRDSGLTLYDGADKDFDAAVFDKASTAYKASFVIAARARHLVAIELDVCSSAISGELNLAAYGDAPGQGLQETLLISAQNVLDSTKTHRQAMEFYHQNGFDVLQISGDGNDWQFAKQDAAVKRDRPRHDGSENIIKLASKIVKSVTL